MNSDDDQPIVMEVYVGFNYRDELVVSVDLIDYEQPCYNCSTAAVVNADDARQMAKSNDVSYRQLPSFIADCMAGWKEVINPNFEQVKDCFKEITECLLDEGCRFKIERTFGPNDRICC